MKTTLTLAALLATALLTGCATMGDTTAGGTGNAAFDEAAKVALDKNKAAMKEGYAWTSTSAKNKYDTDKTEEGKAFKASGKKVTLVEVALFEGEQALKKGDEAAAMKKVKLANELADAQLAQKEQNKDFKILWK